MENGIIPDNISSLVHCFGLHLQIEGRWHPAYEVFCDRQEPFALTMENLRGLTGAFAERKQVYIVENEMVFSYLLEQLKNVKKTILCTSGQPRTAALKLIEALLKSGIEIFYSGDLGSGTASASRTAFGSVLMERFRSGGWHRKIMRRACRQRRLGKMELRK